MRKITRKRLEDGRVVVSVETEAGVVKTITGNSRAEYNKLTSKQHAELKVWAARYYEDRSSPVEFENLKEWYNV